MRLFIGMLMLLLGVLPVRADALGRHFFGSDVPQCSTHREPVTVVADLTLEGEVDDSISLYEIAQVEHAGCIVVRAVVSIFGNGESTTAEVHRNLQQRLRELGLWERWGHLLLRGPDHSMMSMRTSDEDTERYRAIAAVVNASPRPMTIIELGPMPTSATLLKDGYVPSRQIGRILGVGGRVLGETFGTGRGLGALGSFSDFNVRKDTAAVDYLVRYHGRKLSMVTYRTGVGGRMVPASLVAETVPALATHADARTRFLERVGYAPGYIPSWDTWLTSFFIKGGPERLGCTKTRARILIEEVAYNLRLILDRPIGAGHTITACHHKLRGP